MVLFVHGHSNIFGAVEVKKVDIEFVRRAVLVLTNGVALKDEKQVRGATEALAKEFALKMPG